MIELMITLNILSVISGIIFYYFMPVKLRNYWFSKRLVIKNSPLKLTRKGKKASKELGTEMISDQIIEQFGDKIRYDISRLDQKNEEYDNQIEDIIESYVKNKFDFSEDQEIKMKDLAYKYEHALEHVQKILILPIRDKISQ